MQSAKYYLKHVMKSTSGLHNADLSRQRLNCFRPEAKIPENGYVKDWVWWRETRWGRSVFKRDRERREKMHCAHVQMSVRVCKIHFVCPRMDGWECEGIVPQERLF